MPVNRRKFFAAALAPLIPAAGATQVRPWIVGELGVTPVGRLNASAAARSAYYHNAIREGWTTRRFTCDEIAMDVLRAGRLQP